VVDAVVEAAAEWLLLVREVAPGLLREGLGMDGWIQDLRFGLRSLLRRPGFAGAAVGTLALGIGATVAIFSIVHGVLLRPLPYPDAERIVRLWSVDTRDGSRSNLDHPDVRAWQENIPGLTISGYTGTRPTLAGLGDPEVLTSARVTDGMLGVFGLAPALGRDLTAADDVPDGPRVVVLSHGFWTSRLGGRRDVLGETLNLSGEPWEIVGVAPEGFTYPGGAQLWMPMRHDPANCGHGCRIINAVARIQPSTSPAMVEEGLALVSRRLAEDFPDEHRDSGVGFASLQDDQVSGVRTAIWVLMGAVVMVLLIACANVANLLLVRSADRMGEVALRATLGAPRIRLVRQLLTESLMLAVAGGVGGVALAAWGLGGVIRMAPAGIPRLDEAALDGPVLAFALGTVAAVTVLFGLVPALRVAGRPLNAVLSGARGSRGGRRGGLSRSLLLSGEVALSLVLLMGAGLLFGTLRSIRTTDLGFSPERVERFRLSLPDSRYDTPAAMRFLEELERRLQALPEVAVAGTAFGAPLSSGSINTSVNLLDRDEVAPPDRPNLDVRPASPGYREALGIPLVRGRWFTFDDVREMEGVAVVNQAAAATLYPDMDPVGKRVLLDMSWGYDDEGARTIVGVVGDTRNDGVTEADLPAVYVPNAQLGANVQYVTLRLAPGAPSALPAARETLASMDGELAITFVQRLEDAVDAESAVTRFYLTLLGVFSTLALVLAAVGLYGVVAYAVSRRTREIGIRVALGAGNDRVVGMVVREGLAPALVGVVAGLAGSLALGRIVGSILYGVSPSDPRTMATVTGILLAVTLAATLLPARRAALVPPATALRSE
jgi:predicted permease